mmetsp:Transcript_5497/g.13411  ORF Transcript_5497/g.13411 Transcript_5497/m.13411 type:complete len:284 (+) Transcript_5497:594-1445(+)
MSKCCVGKPRHHFRVGCKALALENRCSLLRARHKVVGEAGAGEAPKDIGSSVNQHRAVPEALAGAHVQFYPLRCGQIVGPGVAQDRALRLATMHNEKAFVRHHKARGIVTGRDGPIRNESPRAVREGEAPKVPEGVAGPLPTKHEQVFRVEEGALALPRRRGRATLRERHRLPDTAWDPSHWLVRGDRRGIGCGGRGQRGHEDVVPHGHGHGQPRDGSVVDAKPGGQEYSVQGDGVCRLHCFPVDKDFESILGRRSHLKLPPPRTPSCVCACPRRRDAETEDV